MNRPNRQKSQALQVALCFAGLVAGLIAGSSEPAAAVDAVPEVRVHRLPAGAVQPQVAVVGDTVHLVFLKGDPKRSDVFYSTSSDGGESFSTPLAVNSVPGSAIAMGTIRGARLAVGPGGAVHVAWNGSGPAAGFFYTHLKRDGSGFEPQRNLMTHTVNLDGGGDVAADDSGRVFAVWHARDRATVAEEGGEGKRAVYLSRSEDGGATFAPEAPAWNEPTGACGCCQLSAKAAPDGKLWLLYRSATEMVHRDTYALRSADGGKSFQGGKVHEWNLNYCPMSSYSLAFPAGGTLAAWETRQQVYFSPLTAAGAAPAIQAAPGMGKNRKYPVLATNASGGTLLAWTENTSWANGGAIKWQLYDAAGQALPGGGGNALNLPAWDAVAAFARADGSFELVY